MPLAEAVLDRSRSTPLVAPPVSLVLDDILANEPVSAITEPLWGMENAWPVVRALVTIDCPMPLVSDV